MEVANDFDTNLENNTSLNTKEFSINIDDLPLIFAFVCTVGLLTNSVLIYVLTKTKHNKTSNSILLKLAIADLTVHLFYLPFVALAFASPSDPFCEALHTIHESFHWASTGAWMFTLVALSAHLFFNGPVTAARWSQRACIAIAVVPTLATVLSVPTQMLAYVTHYHDGVTGLSSCLPFIKSMRTDVAVRLGLYVAFPLVAVAFIYCVARLKGIGRMQSQELKYFLHLVLVLTAVYAICFVPVYVVDLWVVFHPDEFDDVWHVLVIVTSCLSFAYRFVNLVVLYCASGAFRRMVNRHLLCCCVSEDREPVARDREPAMQSLTVALGQGDLETR